MTKKSEQGPSHGCFDATLLTADHRVSGPMSTIRSFLTTEESCLTPSVDQTCRDGDLKLQRRKRSGQSRRRYGVTPIYLRPLPGVAPPPQQMLISPLVSRFRITEVQRCFTRICNGHARGPFDQADDDIGKNIAVPWRCLTDEKGPRARMRRTTGECPKQVGCWCFS